MRAKCQDPSIITSVFYYSNTVGASSYGCLSYLPYSSVWIFSFSLIFIFIFLFAINCLSWPWPIVGFWRTLPYLFRGTCSVNVVVNNGCNWVTGNTRLLMTCCCSSSCSLKHCWNGRSISRSQLTDDRAERLVTEL